jgi:arylsulfatase A-like enzyme
VYLSDQGKKNKASVYEGGVRIPFMVRWKGKIKPGQKCDELVQTIDIAPTVFDACGATRPVEMDLDGMNLMPLLTGRETKWRDTLFMELGCTRAVCTKRWKYIALRYPEGVMEKIESGKTDELPLYYKLRNYPYHYCNPTFDWNAEKQKHYFDLDQLYDLEKDPEEQVNLAKDPAFKDRLEEMKERLKKFLVTFPDRPFGEFVPTKPR